MFGNDCGADPKDLERDGTNFAMQAVQCDKNGHYAMAVFYYTEASQALQSAAQAGSKIPSIIDKANEYLERAKSLKDTISKQEPADLLQMITKSKQQLDLERASFLVQQAFQEDEGNNVPEAVELYTEAVELCISIRQNTADQTLQEKVTKLANQALDRAENLKSLQRTTANKISLLKKDGNRRLMPPLGFGAFKDDGSDGDKSTAPIAKSPTVPGLISVGPGGYTKEEIDVLRYTSIINGKEYLPFMSVDVKERFAFPLPINDKHGKLTLSPKQKERFGRWGRPEEFCDSPQIVYAVSSMSIKQTIVSDCSFVASLAISAQYERRFKKKLITRNLNSGFLVTVGHHRICSVPDKCIIYPQNKAGEPMYNPCGKYMVKLHINGVQRKVVIDDFLPLSHSGELLCSFSNNRNELWVCLLEKAYMKVMGGYDFPGSNSNIDLHALTGWIPERVAIRPGSSEFDKDKEFKRIMDRFHRGHCLVTIATGDLSDADAERAGLVPTHAYAMLDIKEVKQKKMFMLKNPWSHLRWKGNYSEKDTRNWTPELQKALNFDPQNAQMFDNGVFWIDYESVCRFYDVIYINWNPQLFSHTTCIHNTWSAKEGPKKDSYNISDNPQYRLQVNSSQPSAVWILLTRHITDKDDFANNREFITVLVYKTDGKKVFYPYDPPPYKDGVRINSPHYLCKLIEDNGPSAYTLIISQYEKNNTIHYTLRVYSTCEFSLTKITEPYKKEYDKRITGQWKGPTAGGCANFPETHRLNPIYQIKIDNSTTNNHLQLELRGPKQYSVGFEIISVSENVPDSSNAFKRKTSGDFRPGYCVLQLSNISGGVYNIMPCTFQPGKEAPFFLDFSSSVPITATQLQ